MTIANNINKLNDETLEGTSLYISNIEIIDSNRDLTANNITANDITANSINVTSINLSNIEADTIIINEQLGIGTDTPNSSAILDIVSTSQGVLLPRMNGSDQTNISLTPPEGLLIYSTTDKSLCVHNGTTWGVLANNGNQNNFLNNLRISSLVVGDEGITTSVSADFQSTTLPIRLPKLTQSTFTNLPNKTEGQIFFDTTNKVFKGYNGTGWVILG